MIFFSIELNENLKAAASVNIYLNEAGEVKEIVTKKDNDKNLYIYDHKGNKNTLPPGTVLGKP